MDTFAVLDVVAWLDIAEIPKLDAKIITGNCMNDEDVSCE
jgi:hypothetical protein